MSSMTGNMGMMRSGSGSTGNKIPSGYKSGQMQNFTPEQMQLFQQMFSQVSPDSFLSKLAAGDQDTFNQMEAPAMKQFNELQGALSSRFSGMGTGARKSSGFQNTANQATSDFAMQLQSQRQQLQRQALNDLMGISQNLLGQKPYENFLVQKENKPTFGQKILGGGLGLAGGAIGGFFGGPAGAAAGFGIGNSVGNAFSGQGGGGSMDWSGISALPTSWGNSGAQSQFGQSAVGAALRGGGLR